MSKNKLKKYTAKRKETPEPEAKIHKRHKGRLRFVVQKHAARRLHYDFRLEAEGVLKSWAVPKGPSLDPSVKRLAIMVEDHPFDYHNFEGIIPKGYGAGTVMIWDQGTYDVDGKPSKKSEEALLEGLEKGAIHFTLSGSKLKGKFTLVKLNKENNEWILMKARDAYSSKGEIIQENRSVISNRTLEEISGEKTLNLSKTKQKKLLPMLATLVDQPFDNKEWFFEIKLDGFRALAELDKKRVNLYSRNLKSFNQRFPSIVEDLKSLGLDAVLDGEIVALDEKGVSQFQLIQNYKTEERLFFYVFDILYLNGRDLRKLPLVERKSILKTLVPAGSSILFLDHVEEKGKKFFQLCKENGLEGIIGKKKGSVYASGIRTRNWVKIKAELGQEVVICGYTEPRKSRKNFGALIAGVYRKGALEYAGHVGGGFTEKKLEEVKELLAPLATEKCPFRHPPKTNTPVKWVEPELLCEVKFKEWTDSGVMRMPIFLALRTDKPAKSIKREKKEPVNQVLKAKKKQPLEEYDFITNTDKLFWEEEGIKKGDLLLYYDIMAPFILPYLKDRPESLRRFPNGIAKPSFFQKNIEKPPEWLETYKIAHHNKTVNYMLIQDAKSLLFAANLGCIEIHPWFSRIQSLEKPDFMTFDLDPEAIAFDSVVETALALHEFLDKIKVPNFCKTSGSRGLHVIVPLGAKYAYEEAKRFAELAALIVHQKIPKITSLERSPSKRQKMVYIDCYQNNFGQTLAAPYSLRAKPGAPVSTPLEWKEVELGIDPLDYTLFNTIERLNKKGDLFHPILGKGMDLKKALKEIQQTL